MVTVREAQAEDAQAAVDVVRRSIIELCGPDHKGDSATLAKWLENKTPGHFTRWLATESNYCAVALEHDQLVGVTMLNRGGEVSLFYLAPHVIGKGIGRSLHVALEMKAVSWQLKRLHLESTSVARSFYEAMGYVPTGGAKPRFGVLRSFPYEKILQSC